MTSSISKAIRYKVTEEQVENWLASDVHGVILNANRSQLIELVTELANGEYKPERMRQDILDSDYDE